MIKTSCEQSSYLICDNCGEDIYTCDGCKNYFIPGGTVFCNEQEKHYCESCEGKDGGG